MEFAQEFFYGLLSVFFSKFQVGSQRRLVFEIQLIAFSAGYVMQTISDIPNEL
jgi:hypothetical protein